MKFRLLSGLGIALLLLLGYLFFFPVQVDPVSWRPPRAPALDGKYEVNNKLGRVLVLYEDGCEACEDVAIDGQGRLYGSSASGEIIRFDGSKSEPELFSNTGGRPLGMHFDFLGNLLVADADKGLLSIDPAGQLTTLATAHNELAFGMTDDVEVGRDGKIYFSDATYRFDIHDYKMDLLEHRPNGRLMEYDPVLQETKLLLDDLYFANGVAVAADQSFVLVVETGAYRVRRYWLKGNRAGQNDVFIQNLPGFPDGISRGSNGVFWLTLVSPRNPQLDKLMVKPFQRKILARLPASLQPAPERYGFVLGINERAQILYNLQDPEGKFAQITNAQEYEGQLYLGSLADNGIGTIQRPR
ncbi:MAG: SMP-30/gluconolactonase/LRE family protein [Saprospiraceae bacterium]|nr:SMP-30/gluconolactonase/LRE family protein [Saprospiraceae bacterium]